jgi:16S rRNA processing protein RimM
LLLTLSDLDIRAAYSLRQILHIGRITRPHGLLGEVKVELMSDAPDRLAKLSRCLLVTADEQNVREVEIQGARPFQDNFLIKLRGIDDRDQAGLLRGCFLSVRREDAISLPPDQWFICDLIGCSVYDPSLGCLGKIADIISGSAQDVCLVRLPGEA